ncbi:hypothetical protein ACFE04_026260 [Oxalis oulophora]
MALTIDHTLLARNSFGSLTSSHCLSTGQYDASVPEMLTYKLINPLCVVTEINIKPFQDYSASAVRFRLGYANPDSNRTVDKLGRNENRLQKFNLPKPVLCIGVGCDFSLEGLEIYFLFLVLTTEDLLEDMLMGKHYCIIGFSVENVSSYKIIDKFKAEKFCSEISVNGLSKVTDADLKFLPRI